jgi:hypothetical protein
MNRMLYAVALFGALATAGLAHAQINAAPPPASPAAAEPTTNKSFDPTISGPGHRFGSHHEQPLRLRNGNAGGQQCGAGDLSVDVGSAPKRRHALSMSEAKPL